MNGDTPFFTNIIKSTGNLFFTSQMFATVESLAHAIFKAPQGKELSDFYHEFKQRSEINGINLSTWAIINAILEPHIEARISEPVLQKITCSVLTSAFMSIRSGPKGIAKNAVNGFAQSLIISTLQSGLIHVARPIDEQIKQRNDSAFHHKRSEYVIKSPSDSILSVFQIKNNFF